MRVSTRKLRPSEDDAAEEFAGTLVSCVGGFQPGSAGVNVSAKVSGFAFGGASESEELLPSAILFAANLCSWSTPLSLVLMASISSCFAAALFCLSTSLVWFVNLSRAGTAGDEVSVSEDGSSATAPSDGGIPGGTTLGDLKLELLLSMLATVACMLAMLSKVVLLATLACGTRGIPT